MGAVNGSIAGHRAKPHGAEGPPPKENSYRLFLLEVADYLGPKTKWGDETQQIDSISP